MFLTLSLVALGGALGAMLRFLLVAAFGAPWAVMAVNVAGSFAIGLLTMLLAERPGAQALLMTGLLGGFTTFSAFSLDTLKLWQAGAGGAALLYAGGSVALSLAGAALGLWLGRGMVG